MTTEKKRLTNCVYSILYLDKITKWRKKLLELKMFGTTVSAVVVSNNNSQHPFILVIKVNNEISLEASLVVESPFKANNIQNVLSLSLKNSALEPFKISESKELYGFLAHYYCEGREELDTEYWKLSDTNEFFDDALLCEVKAREALEAEVKQLKSMPRSPTMDEVLLAEKLDEAYEKIEALQDEIQKQKSLRPQTDDLPKPRPKSPLSPTTAPVEMLYGVSFGSQRDEL